VIRIHNLEQIPNLYLQIAADLFNHLQIHPGRRFVVQAMQGVPIDAGIPGDFGNLELALSQYSGEMTLNHSSSDEKIPAAVKK